MLRDQLKPSLSGEVMLRRHSTSCASASPSAQRTPEIAAFARTGYSVSKPRSEAVAVECG
eukprot:scaffold24189_cov72-Phaeocystis_antarctica.AAC.2